MELTIDFETRSKIDLKKVGAYRYAEDESTEVLMLAVKVDGDTVWVWVPFEFESFLTTENYERLMPNSKLEYLITHASVIHAHNAPFERVIWREIMHKRHGFPDIPLERWSCTAARAANAGLPRDLARACQAAGCPIQKDDEGHKLMLKMCKPRKPTKSNPAAWHMNEADFNRLLKYCIQDVDAEHALGKIIPELPERERKVWLLDQTINDRGVAVDLDSIDAIQEVVAEYESRLLAELHEITDGVVDTAKQVAVLRGWLAARGVVMADLQRQTVEDTLAAGVDDDAARRVLEIRQCLNKSSLAKLEAMRSCACSDGRVRGSLLYCGAATTKRWAGRLIQPQNLPRGTIGAENVETALFYLTNGGEDCLPWELMASASACIRSLIVGDFVCGDFSAIEARITAWLADELVVLTAFREGKDVYKVAASGIYGVEAGDVDKAQRQIGKVAILACVDLNALVVTDKGNVPLKDVTTEMKVWDGVEFVSHNGLDRKGEKRTIELMGLSVTPDHLICTGENEWAKAEDLIGSTNCLKKATCLGNLSFAALNAERGEASRAFCVSAPADGMALSRCTTYEKGRQPDATHARRSNRRSVASLFKSLIRAILAVCLTGLARLFPGVITQRTKRLICTADAAYTCSKNGERTNLLFSHMLQAYPGGTTRLSPSTASMSTGDTSRATFASSASENNSGTNARTSLFAIKVSECLLRIFGRNTAPATHEPELLQGSCEKERRQSKSSPNRPCAEEATEKENLSLFSILVGLLPLSIFGKSSVRSTPNAAQSSYVCSRGKHQRKSEAAECVKEVGDLLDCGPRNRFAVVVNGSHLIVHNCGFAGGVGAFQSMAKNYGVHIDDEKAELIVKAWRQANQNIVKMWYAYEGCMKSAIRNPGEVFGCNRVKFLGKDNRLHVRLPSGGILSYVQPRLEDCQTPWGQMKEMATFMSVNSVTNQWERAPMSAGCLTENIVQATARDMLVEAMFNAEAAGAKIVMTVHDEILAEGCDLETLLSAMRIVPEWADGFPLDAAGWEGKRYRKD